MIELDVSEIRKNKISLFGTNSDKDEFISNVIGYACFIYSRCFLFFRIERFYFLIRLIHGGGN